MTELESKGKKISEESKKWIGEIAKLTDKSEELRDKSGALNKQLETLTQEMAAAQKSLNNSHLEKKQLEQEDSSLSLKIASLNDEIQVAKEQVK